MKNPFRTLTTLDLIDIQIAAAERDLLTFQATAEKYKSMVDGTTSTLNRLRRQRKDHTAVVIDRDDPVLVSEVKPARRALRAA